MGKRDLGLAGTKTYLTIGLSLVLIISMEMIFKYLKSDYVNPYLCLEGSLPLPIFLIVALPSLFIAGIAGQLADRRLFS